MTDGNRPVRTRMPGGVGGAGSIPVPTRFSQLWFRKQKFEIEVRSSW